MGWVEHCVLWHVYPLGMTGAPVRDRSPDDAGHRLEHLGPWLDHAVELGASGLSLGPIFESQTHGYDTTDHLAIDRRLGDDHDFDTLVAACRERGLRLVLDGVFNHVGAGHPWFVQALQEGPGSRYAPYFSIDWEAPGGPRAADFEGHRALVALDHSSPEVVQYVTTVMRHWLDRGADGWRLDAAYAVPAEFWAAVLPTVRAHHPDAWIVGEVIHGDYAGVVTASGMDSVTQYELWKAVWGSLLDRNFFELDWCLTRHNGFLEHFTPHTFVGNHDVTRIASRVGASGAVLALVVLMTTGGVPSVYYGDELAFTGVKEERLGGDDTVRPALREHPGAHGDEGRWMYRVHQDLIGLRRRHPWLVHARTEKVELTTNRYVYVARAQDGEGSLTVELDVDAMRAVVRDGNGAVLFSHG